MRNGGSRLPAGRIRPAVTARRVTSRMSNMALLPAPVNRGTRYERVLLATALYDARNVVPPSIGTLPAHFSDRLLGGLWGVILDLSEAGVPIGLIYVAEHVRGLGWPIPDGFRTWEGWLDSALEWWAAAGEPEEYQYLASKVIESAKVRSING